MYREINQGILRLIDKKEPSNLSPTEMADIIGNFKISFKGAEESMVKKAIFVPISKFTNLLLVSGISPKGDEESRFSKIIMFNGEPCKLVWFNERGLTSKDPAAVVFMVMQQTFSATNTIAESLTKQYDLDKAPHVAMVTYYAPMVISLSILDFMLTMNDEIKTFALAMLQIIYQHKDMTMETVNIILDMIENDSIYNLLDNGNIYNMQESYDQNAFWFASKKDDEVESKSEDITEEKEEKTDETVQD